MQPSPKPEALCGRGQRAFACWAGSSAPCLSLPTFSRTPEQGGPCVGGVHACPQEGPVSSFPLLLDFPGPPVFSSWLAASPVFVVLRVCMGRSHSVGVLGAPGHSNAYPPVCQGTCGTQGTRGAQKFPCCSHIHKFVTHPRLRR